MPQNNTELLQDLINKYARMYMKFAYEQGAPYDDLEDIVMDAFWCFYKSEYFGTLDEKETKIMMAKIVKNKCIDLYRKNSHIETAGYEDCAEEMDKISLRSGCTMEAAIEQSELSCRIREAVEALKDIWREPVKMYYLEGRTPEEICKALEISYDTLRSRLSRARRCLEEELRDIKDAF